MRNLTLRGIRLKCNLCANAIKTDVLWLRLIRGRYYLVCFRHLAPKVRMEILRSRSNGKK